MPSADPSDGQRAFGCSDAARCAIVIPAYNEAQTIGRLLRHVEAARLPNDIPVVVVSNGCRDGTDEIARQFQPAVEVLDLAEASKVAALNAGIDFANARSYIFADADILIEDSDLNALVQKTLNSAKDLVQPKLVYDLDQSSHLVRSYYRAWMRHPYFREKVGAIYGVTVSGMRKLQRFPNVTADDTYARDAIGVEHVEYCNDIRARVRAPQRLGALVRIKSRSLRGSHELAGSRTEATGLGRIAHARARAVGLARAAAAMSVRPYAFAVFACVSLAARRHGARGANRWERDDTSRIDV